MAAIEIRNAMIRVQDGFSGSADVNNGAGYAAGATSMVMQNASTTIPLLASFHVDGDPVMHIVTATNGSTTMTFTPALTEAVIDGADIVFGGRTLEVKVGEGNLNYTEARTVEYILDRDRLDNVRLGADVPVDVSLDYIWEFLTHATMPTVEDAIKKRGGAADWVSTDPDACRPYAVDISIEHIPPCGDEDPELIVLADFRWESLPHDLRGASVAMTGKCNVTEALISRPDGTWSHA